MKMGGDVDDASGDLVHDVGDGLAPRQATADDGDQLVAFNRFPPMAPA